MKKLLLALASLFFAAAASAQFTGVYMHPLKPGTFISVHQNGATVLMINLNTMGFPQTSNWGFTMDGVRTVRPSTLEYWGYSMGPISGNTARVQGSLLGLCYSDTSVISNADGSLTVRLNSITPSAITTAAGATCTAIASELVLPRIF